MSTFRLPQLIESDTLLLRPPQPSDAQALFDEMLSDVETTLHLGFPRHTTLDDTLAFIELSKRGWETGALAHWLLEDKASGRITALIEMRPEPPRVELGVIISRRGGARRRRDGLYALRRLLKWLLVQPPIFRIYAYCAVDGHAHSSMERLGFRLEGRLTNHEYRPNLDLFAGDSYLYAMTRPVPVLTENTPREIIPARVEKCRGKEPV
ncbi:GNAT family N-acetyltransferase [Paraburkholderia sediminicola]|uniref:GNAT family N-acetyltransferase n=1 Tax=Paraburkholderia sediminicola TaxID=458836 RepID=UPI0038BAE1B8